MSSKAAVWSKRLAAWRSSGESAMAFCRARGLPYSQFVYWQRRSSAKALVPVVIEAGALPTPAPSGMEVELSLPSGIRLRVTALPLSDIAALVRALC